MDPLVHLHDFVLAPIIELLDPLDVIRLQRVSKTWRDILSSEWVSRVALKALFPNTLEFADFHDNPYTSVVLPFRRAAYRLNSRRLARPTNVYEVLLDCSGANAIEWDAADEHAAWTSEEDRHVRVQCLTEGPGSRVLIDLKGFCCGVGGITEADLERSRTNVQMGKGLLVLTLNFYDSSSDGYGYGRRAIILVFSIPDTKLLWKLPVSLLEKLLGEVDFSEDRLTYIRKDTLDKPRKFFEDGVMAEQKCVLHFVAHDIRTGELLLEAELERSWELMKGDQFFVMVTDKPFSHLIILHEDTSATPSTWGSVFVKVFSIDDPPGKLLTGTSIQHNPFLGHNNGRKVFVESDLYMDYPPKADTFWVIESCFLYIDKPGHSGSPGRALTGSHDFGEDPVPESVAFSAWSVGPKPAQTDPSSPPFEMIQSVYRSHVDEDRDYQRIQEVAVESRSPLAPANHIHLPLATVTPTLPRSPAPLGPEVRDRCQRFEIFLPEEHCSATFYNVQTDEGERDWFRVDIGSYEFQSWENGSRQMLQTERRALSADYLISGKSGGEVFAVNDGKLEVRGEVFAEFLHGVQWSERHLALRTSWKVDEDGDGDGDRKAGIVVFDFGAPF